MFTLEQLRSTLRNPSPALLRPREDVAPRPAVAQPFTLADPATFPCAFLATPDVDLRCDR